MGCLLCPILIHFLIHKFGNEEVLTSVCSCIQISYCWEIGIIVHNWDEMCRIIKLPWFQSAITWLCGFPWIVCAVYSSSGTNAFSAHFSSQILILHWNFTSRAVELQKQVKSTNVLSLCIPISFIATTMSNTSGGKPTQEYKFRDLQFRLRYYNQYIWNRTSRKSHLNVRMVLQNVWLWH